MTGLLRGRRPRPVPEPLLQTMTLPNGRFLLVLSGVGDAEVSGSILSQLPELTGAAAVLVYPDPLTVLSADPVAPVLAELGEGVDRGFLRAVLDGGDER